MSSVNGRKKNGRGPGKISAGLTEFWSRLQGFPGLWSRALISFFLRCSFGKSFVASLSPFTPPHGAMSLNEASPGNLDEWVQIE